MKLSSLIILASALVGLNANAQAYKEGYVQPGGGSSDFATMVNNQWATNGKINDDDNFYISRVKPHQRFRNAATQVRPNIDETTDKHLVAWLPVNNPLNNALPDGVFDSECFTMWSYVTHWGNWSASLGRIPATFLDVAHKNGVPVSGVAGIPNANLNNTDLKYWADALKAIGNTDPELAARFFRYYGIDGMGYNSEFYGSQAYISKVRSFHAGLIKAARKENPLFENIWYDGTNDDGLVTFDQGLNEDNDDTFGDGDNIRTSLFFNYNWNRNNLLSRSVSYAKEIGRDPLDLYAGVNMQGNEPNNNNWPQLKDYPISIGLWGAHECNMFWESRGEKGSDPGIKQNSYFQRIERWFTGGTRNPANCPTIINSNKYNVENYSFHGMSSMMTARSPLCWNLDEEPFITHFNVGNGRFFNYDGKRQHDGEWYNISAQDYQPTWHYWFASSLLGRTATDVPTNGLDATYTWDDAWLGGSTIKITGSTDNEYLHLFKTDFNLKAGDVITLRYKLNKGKGGINLVLTTKGNESVAVNESDFNVMSPSLLADEDVWETRSFTIGEALDGKDLALVALHFENARGLDLLLGEFSIVRGTSVTPAQPQLASTTTLSYSRNGVDAKIIWNMPNNKAADEPCYNLDVNTAFFKVYAQQEGADPILMGICTSWADLIYNIPIDVTSPSLRIHYGVSAVSLDHKNESPIAWSDYEEVGNYQYSDDVTISKTLIKPHEDFTIGYVDPKHEDATWTITDTNGRTLHTATGREFTVAEGLDAIGSYNLTVEGYVGQDGQRTKVTRTFGSFIQVSDESVGALPRIYTLTANDEEADIEVEKGQPINFRYTGRKADGAGSQGVDLREARFGTKCADLDIVGAKSFSVGFWLKINELAAGETQLFSIANKLDTWPKTDWGWVWININEQGKIGSFTFRGTDATSNNELKYRFDNSAIPVGSWVHLALVFDYNASGYFKSRFFINGEEQNSTDITRTKAIAGSPDANGYHKSVYKITNGQVLAIGGNAHGRNGIKGVVDNLIIWDGVVDASVIKASMNDIDGNNLASNVISYWDLEQQAGDDFTFTSVGQKQIAAGLHSYEATGGEGQGNFHWTNAFYTSGCPFITGSAFPVVTKPSWRFKKATIKESEASCDEQGEATITWKQDGDYNVTLTLQNTLGSDSRTFSVISVSGGEVVEDDDTDGINSASNASARAYAVNGEAIITFPAPGDYTVQVFNASGRLVATKSAAVASDDHVVVRLAQPGTYIVRISRDGKALDSIKLLNK